MTEKKDKNIIKKRIGCIVVGAIILMAAAMGTFTIYSKRSKSNSYSIEELKIPQGAIKVACVGDSITLGNSKGKKLISYPVQLQEILGNNYYVLNCGMSSATAQSEGNLPYSSLKMYQSSLQYEPDIVIFMLGTNDAKIDNFITKEIFKEEYCNLLATYQSLESNPQIILMTPPTAYPNNGGDLCVFKIQASAVEEIAQVVRDVALEQNLQVIDINNLTADKPELFSDGIHPTTEGASLIANEVAELLADR
ncbi:MAG: GDSL-type esterase/lipase family protein [Mobilitalea sp.]